MIRFLLASIFMMIIVQAAPPAHAAEGNSLPKEMIGEWCPVKDSGDEYERRDCHDTDGFLTIGKHDLLEFEYGCDVTKVRRLAHNAYYVHGNCGYEGSTFKDRIILQLTNDDHLRVFVISDPKGKPDVTVEKQECKGILKSHNGDLSFDAPPEGICVINKSEAGKVLAQCTPGHFCRVSGVVEDCKDSGECAEVTKVLQVTRRTK